MKRFPLIDGSRARGFRAVEGDLDAVVFAMRCDAIIGAENRMGAELHKQPRSPRARSRDLRGAGTMFEARRLDNHCRGGRLRACRGATALQAFFGSEALK
jgi:hypothetical protein